MRDHRRCHRSSDLASTGIKRGRPLTLALALLVLLVAFSGCLGDDTPDGGPQFGVVVQDTPPRPTIEETKPSSSPSTTPTPGPSPSPNQTEPSLDRPPIASVEADRSYGTGPLTVRFQLDGKDPEGLNLSWTFDADGDGKREAHGTELPATVSHTYPIGTWTAVLKVSDGNNTTTKRLDVEAVPPAPTGPPEPVRIRGTITGAWLYGVGFVPETKNHTFLLPRSVERITVTFSTGATAIDLDYELYAPDGRRVGRQAHYNEPTGELPPPFIGRDEPAIVVEGVDAGRLGTWEVHVMPAFAVDGEYVIDIRFT